MPPSRRQTQMARRGAQSTLSFGSNSRVTKPSLPIQTVKKQGTPLADQVKAPESPIIEAESQSTTADIAIEEQAEEEVQKVVRTPAEELAASINETRLKRYWKEREAERKAPRGVSDQLGRSTRALTRGSTPRGSEYVREDPTTLRSVVAVWRMS